MSVTQRQVKNKSGIDVTVTADPKRNGKKGHYFDYDVVVVTRLPHLKHPTKHKPADVIQFGVTRTHKQIAAFRQAVTEILPEGDSLPSLPRRSIDVALTQRVSAMDSFLKHLVKDPMVARSSCFMEFVGLDPSTARERRRAQARQATSLLDGKASLFDGEEGAVEEEDQGQGFLDDAGGDGGGDSDDDDIFAREEEDLAISKDDLKRTTFLAEGSALLGGGDAAGDDDDSGDEEDSLFAGDGDAAASGDDGAATAMKKLGLFAEDTSDLLNVGDDDDDLDALFAPAKKASVSASAKKVAPKKKAATSSKLSTDDIDDLFGPSHESTAASVDLGNLASYLAANTADDDDDDLFG
eukprot:m.7340 g.7340  ORF g.7340 m.7340 type:complete len:353 (+) comp2899_c0_seq1:131-1189(+)